MRLFASELHKQFSRRSGIVAVCLVVLVLFAVLLEALSGSCGWQETDGTSHVYEGLDGIRWEKEICMPFDGRVIDDAFVREVEAIFPDRLIALDEIHHLVHNAFTKAGAEEPIYREDGTVFVKTNRELIPVTEVLGDIQYRYRYGGGWVELIQNMGMVGGIAALVGIFLSAMMYSHEYACGTDAVLLTSKHGKHRLGAVKFMVGLAIPILLVTVTVGLLALLIFSLYGFGGGDGNAALTISNYGIADRMLGGFLPEDFEVTYAGAAIRSFLTVLLMTVICSAIALAVSSFCRSTIASIAVSSALLLVPSFVMARLENAFPASRLIESIMAYMPYQAIAGAGNNWFLRQLTVGGETWRYLPPLAVAAVCLTIGCSVLSAWRYASHQVQ